MREYGFEAEELAKRFGKTNALGGVSLAAPVGEYWDCWDRTVRGRPP